MSSAPGADTCPPEEITELLRLMQSGGGADSRLVDLLARYPADGRLHFLHGSMLATGKQYEAAREAMARAVQLAPYFWIARFQLGLLELSSGLPAESAQTLAPLGDLAADNPLRLFAAGLIALMQDDFTGAVGNLRQGIGRNTENAPLNKDMQMLIDRIEELGAGPSDAEPVSATQLLLQTLGRSGPTKH